MPADTPDMVFVPGKWTRSVEEYLAHYGSGCRDCADEAGACPASGMTCDFDQRMAAFRHALKAINYGVKQGYLALSAPSTTSTAEQVGTGAEGRSEPKSSDYDGIFSPSNACCYRETCRALYTRPTPATPEGLREALQEAISLLWEHCPGLSPRIEQIEAALQPQAQGGE